MKKLFFSLAAVLTAFCVNSTTFADVAPSIQIAVPMIRIANTPSPSPLVMSMEGSKPGYTEPAKTFTALEGDIVVFEVIVIGFPTPYITVLFNGLPLDNNRCAYAYDDGVFTLTIVGVRPEDIGDYTFVATNVYGQASTTAKLIVKSK